MVRKNLKLGLGMILLGAMMSAGTACSQKDADIINKHANNAVKELSDNQNSEQNSEQKTEQKTDKTTKDTKITNVSNNAKKTNNDELVNIAKKSLLNKDWIPNSAETFDKNNKTIDNYDLSNLYGKHWIETKINFYKDGTFTFKMGAFSDIDKGTYNIDVIKNKITFKFNNKNLGTKVAEYDYANDGSVMNFIITENSNIKVRFDAKKITKENKKEKTDTEIKYASLKKDFEGTFEFKGNKIKIMNVDPKNLTFDFSLDEVSDINYTGSVEELPGEEGKGFVYSLPISEDKVKKGIAEVDQHEFTVIIRFRDKNNVDINLSKFEEGKEDPKTVIDGTFTRK